MKANEIHVGDTYTAKISGRIVTVRVDRVREHFDQFARCFGGEPKTKSRLVYDVTNLLTGRHTTFKSAAKFRHPVKRQEAAKP